MGLTQLRDCITILKRTGSEYTDEKGVTREYNEKVAVISASIEQFKSTQVSQLKWVDLKVVAKIKTWYLPTIKELMIVSHSSGGYDIQSIIDVGSKHHEMELHVSKAILLDKTCMVFRLITTKDARNRPVQQLTYQKTYLCTIVKAEASYKQENPNASISTGFVLYGESIMNVMPGDIIEVDGTRYISSIPYKPLIHHTEVEISVKRDV